MAPAKVTTELSVVRNILQCLQKVIAMEMVSVLGFLVSDCFQASEQEFQLCAL